MNPNARALEALTKNQAGRKQKERGEKRTNFHHWKPFMQASVLEQLFKSVTSNHQTGWRSDLL